MNVVLDLVLLALLIGYTVHGLRSGFVYAAFSVGGALLGLGIGLNLVPALLQLLADHNQARVLEPGPPRTALSIVLVAALTLIGQAVGDLIGRRVSHNLHESPGRKVDAAAGGLAALIVVSILVWSVAGLVRQSNFTSAAQVVGRSWVLRGIDAVMPQQVGVLSKRLQEMVSDGVPKVFEGLGAERIVPVSPPDAAVAPIAEQIAPSVAKIVGDAPKCGQSQEGSGVVVATGKVMTNAHVVAGVSKPTVQIGGRGKRYPAQVVQIDPQVDIALLSVPDLPAPPLPVGSELTRDQQGAVAGFPGNGPYNVRAARVRQIMAAKGKSIYGTQGVSREVYSLYTVVRPGNSGGPLVDTQGHLVGLVFAQSLDDPNTGYALTLDQIGPVLADAPRLSRPVDTGKCTRD